MTYRYNPEAHIRQEAMFKRRREIERDESWDLIWQRLHQIPALNFKPEWRVRVVPPYMGAVARFIVETDYGSVSVYLDWHGHLCGWGSDQPPAPYWEAYKDEEASNVRFELDDTEGLLAFIANQVEPDYRPATTSTVTSSTTTKNGFRFVINIPAGGAQ